MRVRLATPEQVDREVGLLAQELPECGALEPDGLERRLGDDGAGPRVAVQQRELAEELAPPELGLLLPPGVLPATTFALPLVIT